MTLFNHVLGGAIIAIVVPMPYAPFVALASHFVFDAFPHFGRHPSVHPYTKSFWYMILGDAILSISSLVLALILFPAMWPILLLCTFVSAFPDFLWPFIGRIRVLNRYYKFAKDIQWGERPWGWILEAIYGITFTTILISLSY